MHAIELRPLSFALMDELAHRAIVRRFPYALFFVSGAEEVSVVAVFHMARHPGALSTYRFTTRVSDEY